MTNYTPGTRPIPKNLLEVAHEETGQWFTRDELENWVFRRFQHLEQRIKILEEEVESKFLQNLHLVSERDRAFAKCEAVAQASKDIADAEDAEGRSEALIKWQFVMVEQPLQSLARRDLIKGAEALERLYDQSSQHMVINRGSLINRARNLRQQAEALQ